ncbi:serine/threonine-protein phosphatase [bacterium]|nr:serine/threonine-protein phosphatase [bacterium]
MGFNSIYDWSKSTLTRLIYAHSSQKKIKLMWALIIFFDITAAILMLEEISPLPYNCFAIPIFLACLFFGKDGVWNILLNFILLVVCLSMRGYSDLLPLVGRSAFELAKWLIVAVFTLVTVENVRRIKDKEDHLDRDMELARTLQRALIPGDCEIGRVKISGIMRQCSTVGGDFYYFRPFQKKYIVFCLGDVMGKGVSASMIMSIIMGFFFEWGKKTLSPAEITGMLNKRLLELFGNGFTLFSTLFYGVFDEESGKLSYIASAHDTAMLIKTDGTVKHLTAEGFPVGALEESVWEDRELQLEAGDKVVLFTDGITEARRGDDFFGMERALRFAEKNAGLKGEDFVKSFENEVLQFTGGNMNDDMAVIAVEIKS